MGTPYIRALLQATVNESGDQVIVDDVGGAGTTIYVGRAVRGVATSEAKWFISKTTVSGDITLTQHATANGARTVEWDERAAATYA